MHFNSRFLHRFDAPLLIIDAADRVALVNDAACALLGQPAEALAQQPMSAQPWRLTTLDGAPLPAAWWRQAAPPLARLVLADGQRRVVEPHLSSLDDQQGWLLALCDATARCEAEQARAHAEALAAEALALAGAGRWWYELDTQQLCWSPQLLALLQLDPADSPSFDALLGWLPEQERDAWLDVIHPAFSDGRPFEIAHTLALPRGLRRVVMRGAGRADAAGQLARIEGTLQDITSQHQAEQQRQALLSELNEAQRLRSIGLLAGGIAHDFNNLLAGVIGNASFLQDDLGDQPAVKSMLNDVMLAANQMIELTNHLLVYSGKSKSNLSKIHIYNALRETYHVIRLSIPFGCDFAMVEPDEPLWVDADPGHLRQILLNLIINAADAVRDVPDGRIRLTMAPLASLPPAHSAEHHHPSGFAHIIVSDNGVGMDAQTLSHIFDPFFTTKRTGRGLGLSAVQGFVRAMGGALDVSSRPGHGTSFHLYLPLSPPDESGGYDSSSWAQEQLRGLVLVVDDELLVQNVCRRTLEREGLEVIVAAQGEEALRWFDAAPHKPALVLLDVVMPGIGGVELLGQLRRRAAELPIIIMSGYTEQTFDDATRIDSRVGFIQKPFYPDELREIVAQMLEPRP